MPKFRQLENHTYEAALDLGASPVYAFFNGGAAGYNAGNNFGIPAVFHHVGGRLRDKSHFTRGAGINTLSTLIYSQVRVE